MNIFKRLSDVKSAEMKFCKRKSSENTVQEISMTDASDCNSPFPASQSFHPLPDYMPPSQALDFNDPLEQAVDECGIYPMEQYKHVHSPVHKTKENRISLPVQLPPIIPSPLSCLKEQIDKTAHAISTLVWHLDVAYEESVQLGGKSSNSAELKNSVIKIHQMHKQYVKTGKELKNLLNLEIF